MFKKGDRVLVKSVMGRKKHHGVGHFATVKGEKPGGGIYLIETDTHCGGHRGSGTLGGKMGHCWWVNDGDLVALSERDEVEHKVQRSLLKLRGVGPKTAAACTTKVMEVLDEVIREANPPQEGERDEDGIKWFPWDKIPPEYRWVSFDGEASTDTVREGKGYTFSGEPELLDFSDYNPSIVWYGNGVNVAYLSDFLSQEELTKLPEEYLETKVVESLIERPK